ncbi:LysR family transcriptional regulator [Planomonospora sp. ID67723]|uniref:LysR family transcriptional regulator n=1 Tax=Planomonospora sp. ID67723 TaxID=2738134 RepID=UPI0018C3C8A1|nr:LysR family transcriptional regulator [Planomonospora sp. ID67723]MBG0831367.1 LysR family transcriptional regulator [Planomonospora sp. ID67723]
MNVELRHLRALATIGDEGSITDAATALHVSQPALSRTLEQLESRLGVRLVERTTRRLALTEAGRRLWEHAHRILAQVDAALDEAVTGASRPLRVAFAWAALGRHTVPLLRAWRDRHPETPAQVRRVDDPEATLRRGEADVAFLRTAPTGDPTLAYAAVTSEGRLAAVPETDPLAEREAVRLADLTDRPVVLCSTAATTGADLWPRARRPRTFQVPGVDEWLTAIATGEAVGVTTAATGYSHPHPGVRYLPLADAAPVTVHLVWPKSPGHPATDDFRRLVRQHLAAAPATTADADGGGPAGPCETPARRSGTETISGARRGPLHQA